MRGNTEQTQSLFDHTDRMSGGNHFLDPPVSARCQLPNKPRLVNDICPIVQDQAISELDFYKEKLKMMCEQFNVEMPVYQQQTYTLSPPGKNKSDGGSPQTARTVITDRSKNKGRRSRHERSAKKNTKNENESPFRDLKQAANDLQRKTSEDQSNYMEEYKAASYATLNPTTPSKY